MTKYPFLLNGVDFSQLVHFRSYQTDRQPVYAGKYTNLEQVDKYVIRRWRGFLSVTTNDMKVADAAALSAALMQSPLQVTYYSFQLGKEVTETMTFTKMPLPLKLSTSRGDWVGGVLLSFTQV